MKWLITGGCGFIGTALIRYLLNETSTPRIVAFDNLSTGTRADLQAIADFNEIGDSGDAFKGDRQLQFFQGDILDSATIHGIARDADVIVHLAANTGVGPSVEDPVHDCRTNVLGTLNVLEAARHGNAKRFVLASSGAPIGEVEPPIHEELAPHPVSPYGASKLAGEGYCSAYHGSFGLETVALRFGNVFGPGSIHKGSVVAKFINQALQGETLEIYGDGTQTRDFIFIDDLVRAIELSATTPNVGGETFQIATNRETTVSELAEDLLRILRQNGVDNTELIHGERRIGDVMRNYSDTSKASERLKWQLIYDLDSGLEATVRYFIKHSKSIS